MSKREAAGSVKVALGKKVRARRKKLRLSQEELAHRAGVHTTYLSAIERGERNPALENLCAISAALGVSLAELFRF